MEEVIIVDIISRLPTAFLRLRLERIEKELEEMPKVYIGRHSDSTIVREYYYENGIKKQHEYALTNEKGKSLLSLCDHRKKISNSAKLIRDLVVSRGDANKIDLRRAATCFDDEFWNRLRPGSSEIDGDRPYEHNGIRMRSRGEVLIAQVLDSMGLTYKYEVRLQIGNEVYYPDFAVWLPEFGRCFLIEFLGMLDSQNYAYKNGIKIGTYLNAGIVINRDILLLCGTKLSMPSAEEIAQDICSLINKYCVIYSA